MKNYIYPCPEPLGVRVCPCPAGESSWNILVPIAPMQFWDAVRFPGFLFAKWTMQWPFWEMDPYSLCLFCWLVVLLYFVGWLVGLFVLRQGSHSPDCPQTHYEAKHDLELLILLHACSEGWTFNHTPPLKAYTEVAIKPSMLGKHPTNKATFLALVGTFK